jgi:thiamine-monophosphate kinase
MTAERQWIAALAARLPKYGAGVRVGIGDDCAVLRPRAGYELVVTTDLLLEGTHFRRDWHSPESAGHRCLARGLSDLAAMGASPLAAFLSLAAPPERMRPRGRARSSATPSWLDRFLKGLLTLAGEHGVSLAGGDTAQSPIGGVMADIVLLGQTPRSRALLRSGAKAGDRLYVTGALGGAAAELLALGHGQRTRPGAATAHPQLFPQPRLAVGQRLLRSRLATAAIDISDGLSTDLDHLCEESGLAAVIDAAALPLHPLAVLAAERGWTASAQGLALHGGEDYELLFTAAPAARVPRQIAGVPVTCIGAMQAPARRRPRMQLRSAGGKAETLAPGGWEHFKPR